MGVADDNRLVELEGVYRRLLPRMARVAAAILDDETLAVDAVHDAFVACVRTRQSFRGDAPIEAWVWRAVVNRALRTRSTRQRNDVVTDPVAVSESRVLPDDQTASVGVVVRLLPERQRTVVFLRYYADLDYRAIAQVLGISPGTVGATLTQAHVALRKALEKEATG